LAVVILSRAAVRTKHFAWAGAALALIAVFYFSPAGTRLRARTAWSGEDPTGGARPLLWRDSLQMAGARPLAGYGPETFESAFGRWQSPELARLYPDFHHESPHNVALDALTSEGIPGLLLIFGWAVLAFRSVAGAIRARALLAIPFTGALVASVTACLFNAMSLSPVLLTLLILAMTLALELPAVPVAPAGKHGMPVRLLGRVLAAILALLTVKLATDDFRLARFQQNPGFTAYDAVTKARLPGAGEDMYASRILLTACESAKGIPARLECWRKAEQIAVRGIASADDTANAWYNVAYFTAAQNDARGTAMALGRAIEIYPNWFKPHWSLARLLSHTGDSAKAAAEAERASFLNANHDPTVEQTAKELRVNTR
jgi:O-antigen ligase